MNWEDGILINKRDILRGFRRAFEMSEENLCNHFWNPCLPQVGANHGDQTSGPFGDRALRVRYITYRIRFPSGPFGVYFLSNEENM